MPYTVVVLLQLTTVRPPWKLMPVPSGEKLGEALQAVSPLVWLLMSQRQAPMTGSHEYSPDVLRTKLRFCSS